MDENPESAAAGEPRRKSWWPSVRIRTKLTVMLLIPTLALAGVVTLRIIESAVEARDVGATAQVVELAGDVNDVIRSIQGERIAAAMLVFQEDTGLDDAATLMSRFEEAEAAADTELAALSATRSELDLGPAMLALLERADKPLERLVTARRAIYADTVAEVHLTVYNSIITRLSAVIDRAIDDADTAELSRHLRTAGLLSAIDENSEQLRILALGLEDGKPLAGEYRPFMRLAAARDEALGEYRRIAAETDPDAAVFKVGGLGAGDARPANTFESQVAGSRSDDDQEIDHAALMAAYDARHGATSALIGESLDATDALASDIRESVVQRLAIEGALAVAALVLAVLIGSGIGRSVTRGLRQLSDSARQIAMVDLPRSVRRVDEQEGLGGLTPSEFASRTTPPLQTKGRNELSEVGEAFNIVHHEAIRISAQQALLRFHVGTIFVRLARRGHSLTGRLTAELDEAERNEQDPERLQRLFRLDHLVSLTGRTNDSLLVLGGASAAKVRTIDAKLSDVLTAAQSRIEYYTRVELMSDDGAWVKSDAVDDAVQLLAELMDNATRYSESAAEVSARVITGRVIIQIRDHGIGMEPGRMAHFNDRLRRRVPIDLEAMQAMGLTVVGHLATRLGIEVELRSTVGGGTVAEVAIPNGLLSFTEPPQPEPTAAAITAGTAPPPEEPLIRRRNAPLFEQSDAPAPVPPPADPAPPRVRPARELGPAPARGRAAISSRPALPAVPAISAPKKLDEESPDLNVEVEYVHADPSLRAGSALPEPEPAAVPLTEGGLPKREPMSNLVPGAVEPTPERAGQPVQRDPRTIGATYSAYARGLAGSRTQQQPHN